MAMMENLFLQSLSTTSLLFTIGILLASLVFFCSYDSQRKDPPGPRSLPLLGNLLDLKSPHSTLYELSKKYGAIFTIHLGPQKVVVLAGYKVVKQALISEDFLGKEVVPIINDLKLTQGIIFANGDLWREMRNFAMTSLKDFGMGKKASEEKIIEESQHLMEVFKEKDGKPFDTTQPVRFAASNVISNIVYGNRFEYDDPDFRSMVERACKNTELMGCASVQLYNLFPWLFHWLGARKQMMKNSCASRRQMTKLIKGLQDTLNPQMGRGLVDSFLARKIHFEASGIMNSHFNEENLLVTVLNLFTAGTDTTSSTLRYGLLLMAKYPQIQDQVQEELSRVVGSRQVVVADRKSLPYSNAVIHEVQRVISVVPKTAHCTSHDVIFQGFFIKKGTTVLCLLSSALHDEEEWEKPNSFHPAHFLDEEGKFRKRDAFLPFSAGPRVCIGETLARTELFLFFTTLLQHFRFTPPPGVKEDELDLTLVGSFSRNPLPQELCAISRV
ncbi:cytochrome P450 2K1-like [Acanthopagrus schlegelii]